MSSIENYFRIAGDNADEQRDEAEESMDSVHRITDPQARLIL